jgi:hypothetical protein
MDNPFLIGSPDDTSGRRISVPDALLEDLAARLRSTRWPEEPRTEPWHFGTDRTYMQELVEYWHSSYDWRHWEARLNSFANRLVTIDGYALHFLIEPGSGPRPLPLLITHGCGPS